jgi:hypothetical protein
MRLREDGLDEDIKFQRQLIRDMNMMLPENANSKGPGSFCCNDPYTGKPLTYWEFFDLHAMTMMVISEVVAREKKIKP